jgi:NodT family efflux transporter outer membrane factor (OMF) lipoprotein
LRLGLAILAGSALTACAVGPNFERPSPDVPANWSATPSPSAQSHPVPQPVQQLDWWKALNDPVLTSLIERAGAGNLDLKAAALRIAEARAERQVAASAAFPAVNGDASWQGQRLSENTPTGKLFSLTGEIPGLANLPGVAMPNPYGQFQLGFDAGWEVDLFGRVRRSVESAESQIEAADQDRQAAQVSLFGEVGRVYIDLRGAQMKRAVAEESLATARELMRFAGERRAAGVATAIDVSRAGAQASATEAQLPLFDREIASDINALSFLVGQPPGALTAELAPAQPLPPTPEVVPIGLPADLVGRRPDIRAAGARLHAAVAAEGVAVADLYPRVTLMAAGGYQAEDVTHLLDWASRFGVVGPQVELPIFDAGRRRANVRVADVRAQEARAAYGRSVLAALHEVDGALTAYETEQARAASLEDTVRQGRDAVRLARLRYQKGLFSMLEVLDAERSLQESELQLADSRAAVAVDLIALYKSLGGGWNTASGALAFEARQP